MGYRGASLDFAPDRPRSSPARGAALVSSPPAAARPARRDIVAP